MNEFNLLLKSFVEENNIYDISFFDNYRKLNDIILKYHEPKYNNLLKNRVGLTKTVGNVYNFFKKLDIDLCNDFVKKINSDDFIFKKVDFNSTNINSYSEYDYLEKRKKIVVLYQEDVFDGFSIVHEFFHDSNLDINNINITRSMFTEFISMYGEILYESYIKKYNIKSYTNNNSCNFWLCFYDSLKVDFLIKIIELYIKNGYINEWFFNNILSLYDVKYHDVMKDYIISLIINQNVDIFKKFKYILGILLSSYVDINKVLDVSDFIEINNSINNLSPKDVFHILDLEISDNYTLELTDDSYNRISNSYIKKLNSR